MSQLQTHIALEAQQTGDRLDRWLGQQVPDLSRSRLQKLIEEGYLRLNGEICQSKKIKLSSGDRIDLTIPTPTPLDLQPENIPLDILYEDEFLIIINKPANLVVHPAPGHLSSTLVHALLFHCQDLAGIGGKERPGIVHRLDKDTTGAMVVAKTDFVHQHLQGQLKEKTAYREYWGVVIGSPRGDEGVIQQPIGRHPVDRKKMAVIDLEKGGREATTHWQVLERLGNYTLMEFRLKTGRTHQIRVHSRYLGFPIVNDPLYGSNHSVGVNLTGQVLHARKLSLIHPISGKNCQAIAPLPHEFTKLLTVLREKFRR
ncbi:MAG: RluA family pseudouridine synthase [Microcystaceae cyanobacterium]